MSNSLLVYNASAGSGKTYTLALEYIALSLSKPEPRYFSKILAITFTNKAAHELKERVIGFMAELASEAASEDKYTFIAERYPLSKSEIKSRAHAAHRQMLYAYSDLHVSTIDSFVLSILRAFSKELGLPFDFGVELDNSRIIDLLVENVLSQVGKDNYITEQVAEFVTYNLDDGKSWNPKQSMRKAIDHLMEDESSRYRKRLSELGADELRKELEALQNAIQANWKQIEVIQESAKELLSRNGLEIEHFAHGRRGFMTFVTKDFKTAKAPTLTQKKIHEKENISSSLAKKEKRADEVEALRGPVLDHFDQLLDRLDEVLTQTKLYRNRVSLFLALRLEDMLEQLEQDEGLTVLRDNNQKISALIQDNPTPFIYERIGERFQHFLIDEFQDTSVLQWRNMLPLLDNALALSRKNFLVGDTKQSIYRWRGSEVDQMVDLPKIEGSDESRYLREVEATLSRSIKKEELKNNFRSSPEVVQFNNELFTELSQSLSERYQTAYSDVAQNIRLHDKKGYASIKILPSKQKVDDILDHVMEYVKEAERDGFMGSDICILCRTKREGRAIAKHLEEQGRTVSSPDSLLLTGHADIQLMMAFIQHLSDTDRVGPVLYILYRLLERVNQLDRYHAMSQSCIKAGARPFLTQFLAEQNIPFSHTYYQDKDVYLCLQQLCEDLSLDQRSSYIQELLNQGLAYIQGKSGTLIGFLQVWEDKKDSMAVRAGVDPSSIQLMTIHKSKGLQFPVVILPLINWTEHRKTKTKQWALNPDEHLSVGLIDISSDLENTPHQSILSLEKAKTKMDNLNLFYVACTRAEERLYVQASDPEKTGLGQLLSKLIGLKAKDNSYHIGTLGKRSSKPSEQVTSESIPLYPLAKRDSLLSLALSVEAHEQRKRRLGDLVHQALETPVSELDLDAFIAEHMPEDVYEEKDRTFVSDALASAHRMLAAGGWDSEDLKRYHEAELISPDGSSHRMDRLYLSRDETKAIIIDFKTGIPANKDQKQMLRYAELAQQMGYKRVETHLLYTQSETVISHEL